MSQFKRSAIEHEHENSVHLSAGFQNQTHAQEGALNKPQKRNKHEHRNTLERPENT